MKQLHFSFLKNMFRFYKFTVTGFAGFDFLDVECPDQLTFQNVLLKLRQSLLQTEQSLPFL